MKYTLMHKNIKTAEVEMDDATGYVRKIGAIYAPEHLPISVSTLKSPADRAALNAWWTDRSIPASRFGVREALSALGISSAMILPLRCLGLSLSDQYWIRPQESRLAWEDINFFDHDFSEDVGNALFDANQIRNMPNLSSPDNTSDGNLKKRWKIINGKRCLIKGGTSPFMQQPFNEVIAAGIMERLGIPHVSYTIHWDGKIPYSVCENFVTGDTELIPAWHIYQAKKRANDVSIYRHFVNACDTLGIKGAVDFLDRMIVLDYLIANEDRHMNNFGALRNAQTLEWIGFAPIYDSGSSLGCSKTPKQMYSENNVTCKPFKKYHEEQLKLVSDFTWFDFDALSDVKTLIVQTLSMAGAEEYIDPVRIRAITEGVKRRTENLFRLVTHSTPVSKGLLTRVPTNHADKNVPEGYGVDEILENEDYDKGE